MEVIGRLSMVLPEQRGEGARGPWVTRTFVIDTEEQFSHKIAFSLFGEDRVTMLNSLRIGETVRVTFIIDSREYVDRNGVTRWSTDCRCSRIETFATPNAMPQNPYNQPQQPMQQPQVMQQPAQPQMQQVQQPQPQVQYQQPPAQTQSMGGTIEQAPMPDDEDDLPF
ncbi:MAG: DUF3127 domain-containing protein [Bacteroidales bacterium]|nr:DUF3127 domain-containing protein [Bacteroidales bacterium]